MTRYLLLVLCFLTAVYGQARPIAAEERPNGNLPMQSIGPNDLIAISVYDSPELTRTARVSSDGYISLPMLIDRVRAEGLMPADLEVAITEALKTEDVLVAPLVTVTISEYHSRPISVMGSVRRPITFQATAPVTLLDALAKAEGLTAEAGPVVLLTRFQSRENGVAAAIVQRIPLSALIDRPDREMNPTLTGGEEILVPAMGRVFVVGNVKRSGAFTLRENGEATVLQMIAVAEGLSAYSGKVAYIYRHAQDGSRTEIPVELQAILDRKRDDVAVLPDDILYIPDNKAKRLTATALERILSFGSTAGASALIYRSR